MPLSIDSSMLPCGVLVLDEKNIIVEANSLFCAWLGYQPEQLVQQPFSMLFTPASKLLYLGHILPKLQTIGLIEEKYLTLKTSTGVNLPVLLNAHKLTLTGKPLFVLTLMKMLRRDLIEEQLLSQRRQAEQANAEKDAANRQLQQAQAELLAQQQLLLQLNKDLAALSVTDALTELFNRRYYDTELDANLALFQRTEQAFALILLDIDFFKSINDTHGHDVGDSVLKALSAQLKQHTREIDTLARIGGEEFAIILPGSKLEDAMLVAERHRTAIATMLNIGFKVTASFGVTVVQVGDTKTSIYNKADKALYHAKSSGRNQVCTELTDEHEAQHH